MWNYAPVITKKDVLKEFTQEQIYSYILKDYITTERKYFAPYRGDKTAGCYFHYYNDVLYFVDFASVITHYTCFSLYSKVFNIGFPYVYRHIMENVIPLNYSCAIIPHTKGKSHHKQKNTVIDIIPKDFSTNEKNYWKQYGITMDQLREDKVISISHLRVNDKVINVEPFGFAYTDFDNQRMKIYQPLNKSLKWISNCTADDIGNINSLNKGYFLIITKSYKDCRVIRTLGYNSIWFQNEGMCPNLNKVKELAETFSRIIIFYDNDLTGIRTSEQIANKVREFNINVNNVYLPEQLFKQKIKDASDLVKAYGYNTLNEFIKRKL